MKQANPAILKMFYGYKLEEIQNPFYSHLLRWNNSNHIKKHFSVATKSDLEGYSILEDLENKLPGDFGKWDYLEKAQWLETSIFMSGYLLSSQGDRMAMANSVEGRYPFLDYRVIEFCNSLPGDFKLHSLDEKYILKKLMKNKIPGSILKRSKQAYRAPIKSAFVSEKPAEYVREMLTQDAFVRTGIFDYNSISGLIQKIEKTGNSSEVDDMVLASVISTHLLHDLFVEGKNGKFLNGTLDNLKIIDAT
jgi:asparagine synthase (glutamine-hydrolysing)